MPKTDSPPSSSKTPVHGYSNRSGRGDAAVGDQLHALHNFVSGLRRRLALRRWVDGGRATGPQVGDSERFSSSEPTRRFSRDGMGGDRRDLAPGRRYLVTGCAGFIGSHLVQALTARGCVVIGVDAVTDTYAPELKERNLHECQAQGDFRFSRLDLAEEPVEALLDAVDGIFHLAARPGVRSSWGPSFAGYLRNNVLLTQRVFEAAAERGIRVVYASSSSVYGDAEAYPLREDAKPIPVSPYGVSKLACEALAHSYARSGGLDAVGLRYFSVYGPRQRPDMAFAGALECLAQSRSFTLLGDGHQTRDFTFVGDVVEATLRAMQRAPTERVYNIGGGSEISLLNALKLLERVVGRRLDVRPLSAAAGDPRRTSADIGQASAELGWRPVTSLEAGLAAQATERHGAERSAGAVVGGATLTRHAGEPSPAGLRAALVIQSFRPHVGGAELQLERLVPRLAHLGVRTEILTRAVKGWPRTESIPGLVRAPDAGRRRVAGSPRWYMWRSR